MLLEIWMESLENVLEKIIEKVLTKSLEKVLEQMDKKIDHKMNEYIPTRKNGYNVYDDELLSHPSRGKVVYNREDMDYEIYNFSCHADFPHIVKNSNFEILSKQSYFIIDNSSGPTFIKLPNPKTHEFDSHLYKEIVIRNLQKHPIYSTDNNVQQLHSKEISNLLPAVNRQLIQLKSNGENWYVNSIYEM